MLLRAATSQLLIVDVQERLLPAMADGERVTHGCRVLLEAAAELGVPATISEQYPKGLGATAATVLEKAGETAVMPKTAFSCADDPDLRELLDGRRAMGRHQVVVAGLEAHVCVLQSSLGLRAAGFEVACVTDAVASRASTSVETAKARMLHAGITLATIEMVLFEWLAAAGTPAFKKLSALIR